MKVYYYKTWNGVQIFGSKSEVFQFCDNLIINESLIKCEPTEPIGSSAVINSIRFQVKGDGLIMIAVVAGQMTISGNRRILESISVSIRDHFKHSPPNQEFHFDYDPDHPSYERGSLGFLIEIEHVMKGGTIEVNRTSQP